MDFEIVKKALRIIAVARKPDKEEFSKIARITGAGMAGIGIIGFLIAFIFRYL